MKTTEKQKTVLTALIAELQSWRDSNDISSPSHGTDIDDLMYTLIDEELDPSLTVELSIILFSLRRIILKIP